MVVDRAALLLRGVLDLCVLEVARAEPVYGYEVQTRLSERGLDVAEGTVYPLLGRLMRLQLLSVSSRPSEQGPPRKYYTLTEAGRQFLEQETAVWRSVRDGVNATLNPARATVQELKS